MVALSLKKLKPQQLLHVWSTFYPKDFINGSINAIQGVLLRDGFYWMFLAFKNDLHSERCRRTHRGLLEKIQEQT